MLSRVDNKYIVQWSTFQQFLEKVQHDFCALEIRGRRQFSYASCYYDDQYACYHEHHQGKRLRFKVRTREYVDTGAKYFEIKFKGRRGITEKYRSECASILSPRLSGSHLKMLRELYEARFGKPMNYDLSPTLLVEYQRCTLVANKGGERVTIDYGLTFSDVGTAAEAVSTSNNFLIIETKSSLGRGHADLVLKEFGVRTASGCSKYCLGVNLTGAVTKCNTFLPTLRRIVPNIIAPRGAASAAIPDE